MAASVSSARALFGEGVRAVLHTWPVLQIAVDNGFGGVYSQQKANWMVEAVQQYFQENRDLEQEEVEDFLSELMNNEFDTVVDDGSLPQVAQKVCGMFLQCQQGKLDEVRELIKKLDKSSGRAKATLVKTPEEEESDDDGDDDDESMECDEAVAGASGNRAAVQEHQHPAAPATEEEDDGWTVVRRRK
ncbi:pre-rRNA-processing protein TSR2 homolog [Hoplias malabaricus]|uniref:pre-rRNA-processing protein TSR2 homolog n=1 Tax=Hoplias malabaricus TaxID=27720 RepID=UPI0034636963